MRKFTFILTLLVFLLLSFASFILQSDWSKKIAVRFISEALQDSGFKVEIEKIEGTLPHAVDLSGIKIESDAIVISIDSLKTRLSLFALLKKELLFTELIGKKISWKEKEGSQSIGEEMIKDLPFTIAAKHMHLIDIAIPNWDVIDLEGSFQIERKNRGAYLEVNVRDAKYPDAASRIIAHIRKNGFIHAKGSLKTSDPFPAHLRFNLKGPWNTIRGQISGTLSPHIPSFEQIEWKGSFYFQRNNETWEISRIHLASDLFAIDGHLNITGQNIKAHASLSPFVLNEVQIGSASANADFSWMQNTAAGSCDFLGMINGKTWNGKTNFSWSFGNSLFLTEAALTGPAIQANGNVEIRTDHLLIGRTNLSIDNLQELPLNLYGSAQIGADWNIPDGIQTVRIEGKASHIYWKEFFGGTVSFQADLIQPFGATQGRCVISGEEIKWKELFLDRAALETSNREENWPFTLSLTGKWNLPLELRFDGYWNYRMPKFTCKLENGSGSFHNHSFSLSQPANLEISPNEFLCRPLDIALDKARLFLQVEKTKEQAAIDLSCKRFPLDLLSLNPLDLKINGWTNCVIAIRETNALLEGTIDAAIEQMEIAALGNTPQLIASGHLEGRFSKDRLDISGALKAADTPFLSLNASLPIHCSLWPPAAHFVYEKKAEGHFALNGRVEEILDFFDLGTHRIEGDCHCDLTLQGTLKKPNFKGIVRFQNGYYENYLTGTRLFDIEASSHTKGALFTLDSFTAFDEARKGKVTASGTMNLQPQKLFPFRFDIDVSHLNSVQIDLVKAEAQGHIEITGDQKGALAKGSIEIIESDLTIPDHIPRPLPDLTVVYRNASKPIAPIDLDHSNPYPLSLDLQVLAPDGIFIRGKGLDSEWKGNFHIGGDYTSVAAKGKLELIKGEFVFSSRSFKLLEGSLSFSGKEHAMPYLNLAGMIQVKDISITARLKGPLNNPQITLQSVPPLPLSSILSYLLFGQELAEINSFQALQLANSLASLAGAGPDVLESTRKSLGVDKLQIVSVPSGDAQIEDAIAVQVGKYISEGVLVSYTQGAEDASGNISIEIELKSGFIFQLESDQRQEQGKFTIKWTHNY